jgi:hypothetical protein
MLRNYLCDTGAESSGISGPRNHSSTGGSTSPREISGLRKPGKSCSPTGHKCYIELAPVVVSAARAGSRSAGKSCLPAVTGENLELG